MNILNKHHSFKKIICSILAIFLGAFCALTPVSAQDNSTTADLNNAAASNSKKDDGCVSTSIIGNGEVCDSGDGDSIMNLLILVVDIMTIGVGILGVVGITIVGIQYLTAGGNEERVRKSKRRMLEIVIGLAAYVVAYAVLRFLIPGFQGL